MSETASVVPVPLENICIHPRARAHDPAKLAELTASIKERTQLQPARGRPAPDGKVEVYIGHGRYLACNALGMPTLNVIVEPRSDEDVDLDMLHENLKREDLDPITEARDYDYLAKNRNWNQNQIAQKVGKSQQSISDSLALLELPEEVQDFTRRLVISK